MSPGKSACSGLDNKDQADTVHHERNTDLDIDNSVRSKVLLSTVIRHCSGLQKSKCELMESTECMSIATACRQTEDCLFCVTLHSRSSAIYSATPLAIGSDRKNPLYS